MGQVDDGEKEALSGTGSFQFLFIFYFGFSLSGDAVILSLSRIDFSFYAFPKRKANNRNCAFP